MISKNLIAAAGNGISTGDVAEAIDFDGTNDYLSRASDLTGNTDGKTFTFSAWFWYDGTATGYIYREFVSGQGFFHCRIEVSGKIAFTGANSSGTAIFLAEYDLAALPPFNRTFYNILVSVDLANTANRYWYVNDQLVSPAWTIYSNQNIDFTTAAHAVGANVDGSTKFDGRLSNVFLDYTYRDLSNVTNRRLFVTADLKPAAGQAALNPILYLPLNDPTAPGANAGTGGNFTLTGTVARSGRGPNQYNAPYSDLDGSADYLSRASQPTGVADNKTFAIAFNFTPDTFSGVTAIFAVSYSNEKFLVYHTLNQIRVSGYNAAGSQILDLRLTSTTLVAGRNYNVVISCDLSDSAKRYAYVNGTSQSLSALVYVNDNFDWTSTPWTVGSLNTAVSFNGRLGAVWFNTSYIDLSVADNLAKFVTGTGIDAKPVDLGASGELPTGTSPLIYLPMYGNNAGKNYGTGGDFTVNSGPYTGARGPNEFWGNKADFNGTTGRLTKSTALTGVSDGKTISGSFSVMFDNTSTNVRILSEATGSSTRFLITRTVGNALVIGIFNSSGGDVVNVSTVAGIFSSGVQYSVQFCFDVTNTAKRKVYINSEDMTLTVSAYNNQDMVFSGDNWTIGALYTGTYSQFLDGKLSEFYLTTDYIDFSQEANRLKFRDAFGNPVNLTQQIEDAAIPNPAIYMRFPPTSFGTNSGTGGNFTVNGTITDGGQL